MKPVSLANISYEQGLELLSLRKQALDSGEAKRLPSDVLRKSQMLQSIGEKAAAEGGFLNNLTGSLSNLGSSVKGSLKNMDPGVKRTLLSGATGAGLGAIGGAFSDDKNRLRNMLMGGIAGGALGGGIGLATNSGVLDKAIDAAVPGARDRARDALKPGSSASSVSAKPGNLSDFGINVSPERMAEIEANRIPNFANPLDNNLSQIEPYATGGGAISAGEYARRKFGPKTLDPSEVSPALFDKIDGLRRGSLSVPGQKPPLPSEVANAFRGSGLSQAELQSLVNAQNSDELARALSKTPLDKDKMIQVLKNFGGDDKVLSEVIKSLRASAGKPMGYIQGAKSLGRGVPMKGKLGLLAAALGLGYGGYRAIGGAANQIKNEVVWNKLKNRLEQVAE